MYMKPKITLISLCFVVLLILLGCSKTEIPTPNVSTSEVTNITNQSAIVGGVVASNNGSIIVERGVCWNTFPNPTISDNRTLDGSGTGSFTSALTGLLPLTTYYVRAYITNSVGTTYGNEEHFTTLNGVINIVTDAVASVTSTEATFSATISGDEGTLVADRGFCWSTDANPSVTNNTVSDGSGTGPFSKKVTGLLSNTTYYVRAYAKNTSGTLYGNEVIFNTLGAPKARFENTSQNGLRVTFSNISDLSTTCLWDFGDGSISTEQSPTHVYDYCGTYNVKLIVSNDGLSDSFTKIVVVSGIVNIENSPTGWNGDLSTFGIYIDVDGDSNRDFFLYGDSHTGPSQSWDRLSILCLGKYGLVSDSIIVNEWDSNKTPANFTTLVHVPKKYLLGDSINDTELVLKNIGGFKNSYTSYSSSRSYNTWNKDEIRYIGYCYNNGSSSSVGWIKLNLFSSLSLYSLKMPSRGKSLMIKE